MSGRSDVRQWIPDLVSFVRGVFHSVRGVLASEIQRRMVAGWQSSNSAMPAGLSPRSRHRPATAPPVLALGLEALANTLPGSTGEFWPLLPVSGGPTA
jgi:hypothetical protein